MTSGTDYVNLEAMTAADLQVNIHWLMEEACRLLTDSVIAYVPGEEVTEDNRRNFDFGISLINEAAQLSAYAEIQGDQNSAEK